MWTILKGQSAIPDIDLIMRYFYLLKLCGLLAQHIESFAQRSQGILLYLLKWVFYIADMETWAEVVTDRSVKSNAWLPSTDWANSSCEKGKLKNMLLLPPSNSLAFSHWQMPALLWFVKRLYKCLYFNC